MISIILPYWNRQAAADKALDLIAKNYADLDLEVVVVDDGSPKPFRHPGFNPDIKPVLRLVTLPRKFEPKATCVPWNRGVSAASGDVIALSSIEMLHETPVLGEMRDELMRGDKNTYVSAAVFCPEQNRWHAHSSLNKPPLNFMTMLHRDLWDRSGGMDEDYRDGICFDDNDFLKRLEKAGMHYVYRDDLVVKHPRGGAKAINPPIAHERNRRLFESKWA